MAELGAEPTLRGYLRVVRRGRWWVAVFLLLGLGISAALSLTATKQYAATAELLVQSAGNLSLDSGASQDQVTSIVVQTELELVASARVQNAVRAQLGSAPGIQAAQVGQTNVIELTAVSSDPARAAQVANAYSNAFVSWAAATTISNLAVAEGQLTKQINALDNDIVKLPSGSASDGELTALSNEQSVLKGQLAQLQVTGATASTGLELIAPATAPTSPSSPKPVQNTLVGLIAGLFLGIGAAFLRDNLDDTLTTGEAVERMGGARVLATVPMVASWRKRADPVVISAGEPTSAAAEAYRSLRTSLQFIRNDGTMRTILVTSPSAGDGKTVTVVNLGAVFAQAGARVVLVSCDLRRPGLSQFIAPGGHAELSSVLTGQQPLDRALSPVPGVNGLWALGTQEVVKNPTELLGNQRMRSLVDELAGRFDIVLIDSPPVLPVADALILSGYVDAVLLVVAAAHTRRGELRRAAEKLAQANAPVVGAVLNKATAEDGYGYGYGYGYGPGYHAYVPSAGSPNGGKAGQNGHGKQNGSPISSGQPGRHGR
jgi:polysaccharide biosynthesis transport protein